ncbi:hypothetical protein EMA8858_02886 [Emticicia aquatica]|uniref:Bacterial sugar transferase domain-containing protein n=1 Tax=Emticicia aquatica TaxID=1681835 RepID=A0ABM9ASS3_9BACT|nr:exopolysaccharide biosynthesis polyprenyl glycosylphosphotransferase [Emticicia aquatica]CAH0996751.1 hypothetical protein EMA8858_02886 [Emticicia aquatica]
MPKTNTNSIPYFTFLGLFNDFFSLNIALGISYYLRYFHFNDHISIHFKTFIVVVNLLWLLFVLISKPYAENRINLNLTRILYNFILIIGLHLLITSFIFSFLNEQYYTPLHLLITYSIFFIMGLVWRILGINFIKWYRASGQNSKKFVVVGFGELSSSIVDFYKNHLALGHQFRGYFDEVEVDTGNGKVYSLETLENQIQEGLVDFIYCCQPYLTTSKLQKLVNMSHKYGVEVKLLVDFRGFLMKGISVEFHDIIPILKISQTPPNESYHHLKRVFDIGFSIFAIIFGLPIFIVLAIVTKLTSKGPIIFSQKRTGQWGKPFKIYKFRSMYVDADEIAQRLLNGDKHSIGREDPRISAWGSFMRETRLDELPQFFNVLLGDMSIVGPRPLPDYDVEMLTKEAPNSFQKLLAVKPGLTSLGQIHFGYASTAQQNVQRMRYDLIYLDKLSLSLDLVLIVKTMRLMVQGRGQ